MFLFRMIIKRRTKEFTRRKHKVVDKNKRKKSQTKACSGTKLKTR